MKSNIQFDPIAYFSELTEKNKLAADNGFFACTCSGPDGIEGVLEQYQRKANFVMIDDTTSQNTFSRGNGFFDKNAYTVFILARFKWNDMADREEKLKLCRRLFRQFHSRLIHDKFDYDADVRLTYVDIETVYSKEFPRYAFNDLTGLYFMINNNEPVDLTYDESEWA